MKKITKDIKDNLESLNKIILSDSLIDVKKIIARPINMKNGVKWQIERFKGSQVFHENIDKLGLLDLEFNDFKQKVKKVYNYFLVANFFFIVSAGSSKCLSFSLYFVKSICASLSIVSK